MDLGITTSLSGPQSVTALLFAASHLLKLCQYMKQALPVKSSAKKKKKGERERERLSISANYK